jgi:ABC-type bacteriocin/lantibiotic exporter with double-glycine peptidase domain
VTLHSNVYMRTIVLPCVTLINETEIRFCFWFWKFVYEISKLTYYIFIIIIIITYITIITYYFSTIVYIDL